MLEKWNIFKSPCHHQNFLRNRNRLPQNQTLKQSLILTMVTSFRNILETIGQNDSLRQRTIQSTTYILLFNVGAFRFFFISFGVGAHLNVELRNVGFM